MTGSPELPCVDWLAFCCLFYFIVWRLMKTGHVMFGMFGRWWPTCTTRWPVASTSCRRRRWSETGDMGVHGSSTTPTCVRAAARASARLPRCSSLPLPHRHEADQRQLKNTNGRHSEQRSCLLLLTVGIPSLLKLNLHARSLYYHYHSLSLLSFIVIIINVVIITNYHCHFKLLIIASL